MASAPLGFDSNNALSFTVTLPNSRYPTLESRIAFNDELSHQLAALPGVTAVAVTNFLPTRVFNSNGVFVLGRDRAPEDPVPFVLTTGASETYFETLQIPLVAGRTFTTADRLDAPRVAVISEAMAKRFWPGGDALGARIRIGPDPNSDPIEVIGIVRDVRTDLTQAQAEAMLYMPLRQGWWGNTFVLRTQGEAAAYPEHARRILAASDAALPISNVITLRDVVSEGLAARRVPMLLMLAFAALALLLACIGIYALFANMALAREREFGVRMALGSSRGAVAALVLRQGAIWMGIGMIGGAIGVLLVSRALRSLICGIAPLDRVSILAAVGALLVSATLALIVPLRRATRADPASVMR